MSFKIFRAQIEDVPGILELYKQEHWDSENIPNAEIVCEPNKYIFIAKDDEGTIVGTAQLDIISSLAFGNKSFGVVEFVLTDKKHRKQGVMTAIFNEIDRVCNENNCESVMLTSTIDRIEAHRFYEDAKFVAPVRGFRKEYPERAITKREANRRLYKQLLREQREQEAQNNK